MPYTLRRIPIPYTLYLALYTLYFSILYTLYLYPFPYIVHLITCAIKKNLETLQQNKSFTRDQERLSDSAEQDATRDLEEPSDCVVEFKKNLEALQQNKILSEIKKNLETLLHNTSSRAIKTNQDSRWSAACTVGIQ